MKEDQIKTTVSNYTIRKLDSMLLLPITEGEKQHITQLAIELVFAREDMTESNNNFIKAILENNLEQAVLFSDSTNVKALKFLIMVKKWCHIN